MNITAPETGATTDPIACSTWSTAGTLSPTKSAAVSTPSTTMRAGAGQVVERLGQLDHVEPVEQGAREQRQPGVEASGGREPEGGADARHVHA